MSLFSPTIKDLVPEAVCVGTWHALNRQSGNKASSIDIEMTVPASTRVSPIVVDVSVNGKTVRTRLRIARIADVAARVVCEASPDPALRAKSTGTAPKRTRV